MKKEKKEIMFVCKECGYESLKWLGKCPNCNSWNSFTELRIMNKSKINLVENSSGVQKLNKISAVSKENRIVTKMTEFDRIMGGGVVIGSVSLIGGEPGVGKSTLMLQIADRIASLVSNDGQNYKVLYISGEESYSQIKLRADRLDVRNENIYILSETNWENIVKNIEEITPDIVIIDSIQTINSDYIPGVQGSVAQIRGITAEIVKLAKSRNITVFILGHVTKEGDIAGPKLLEHMVDTVLYFESETTQNYRILRVFKNRFGSTAEIAVFEMKSTGLYEITNPSEFFVHHSENLVGTVTTCIVEGTRPLLTQVQALLVKSYFAQPRRVVSGIDYNRAMLLISVLEKNTGISLVYEDVYINIVSGLKIKETAVDLAVLMAVYSSHKNITVDSKTVYVGEVGLTGEVRAVSFINERINEVLKLGYKKVFIPYENKKNITGCNFSNSLDIIFVRSIREIDTLF
ncbi:MAG: DNA repair protein RadA [Endomicrobia bacterium]|nr:DNA repair protein RadA [Endomicrobiia bacterium]